MESKDEEDEIKQVLDGLLQQSKASNGGNVNGNAVENNGMCDSPDLRV